MKKVFYVLMTGVLFSSCGMFHKDYTSWKNLYEPVPGNEVVESEAPKVAEEKPVVKKQPENVVMRKEEVKVTHGGAAKSYCIIVGSFGDENNAVSFRKQLLDNGFPGTIIMQNKQGMNRVCVASFDGEQKAREELLRIRQSDENFKDTWLLIRQ